MDYRTRLGSLGNSSIASGSDPVGTAGPSYIYAIGTSFLPCPLYFFLCFFVIFQSCCSHAQVFNIFNSNWMECFFSSAKTQVCAESGVLSNLTSIEIY